MYICRFRNEYLFHVITTKKINKIQHTESIHDLAQSSYPAVEYGWVYTKHFEREKYLALQQSNDNYNCQMHPKKYLQEDFAWWSNIASKAENRLQKTIYIYSRYIYHSSLTGWSAYTVVVRM